MKRWVLAGAVLIGIVACSEADQHYVIKLTDGTRVDCDNAALRSETWVCRDGDEIRYYPQEGVQYVVTTVIKA